MVLCYLRMFYVHDRLSHGFVDREDKDWDNLLGLRQQTCQILNDALCFGLLSAKAMNYFIALQRTL